MDLVRYLVEVRRPADDGGTPPEPIRAARRRAAGLAARGEPIRVLRSLYVPEDDAWFLLVEAPSVGHVERLFTSRLGSIGSITPALTGVSLEGEG